MNRVLALLAIAWLSGCGDVASNEPGSAADEKSADGGETAIDSTGGETGNGGTGGNDDHSAQCETYCELVDKCPCFSEGACIENCVEDCKQSFPTAEALGCEPENQSYLACAITITDECASGYIQDAINQQCKSETIGLLECKSK